MINKKIFLILALALMVMPLVLADDILIKQNTGYDLKRSCINNGTWCSPTAVCNITIIAPNGVLIKNNTQMTNQQSYHNVTLTRTNNLALGVYTDTMICIDSGVTGSETFYHQVTPSGDSHQSLGLYFILLGLALIFTFTGAYYENITLAILGGFMLIFIGLYSLNNGIDIYRNFATEGFSLMITLIGGYFAVTGGMKLIQEGDSNG